MKNKGFTLMELIVVIAIMAIVLGAGVTGISTLANQRVQVASKKIYNMLGSTQTVAMSKGNTYFAIVSKDNTTYVYTLYAQNGSTEYTPVQEEKLNSTNTIGFKAGGKVYYIGDPLRSDGTNTYVYGLLIEIDRSTGKFSKTSILTSQYDGSVTIDKAHINVANISYIDDCTDIYIIKETNKIDIGIVALTGKYYYKD